MDKNDYMQRTIDLAREKMLEGTGYWPYGCLIVKDGEVVGEGCNDMGFSLDPTGHGEIVAIRDACKRLGTMDPTACELYTSCEPCPMCLSAIYWARIDRIFFGNTKEDAAAIGFDDHHIYREIALPADQRVIPTTRRLAEEAITSFLAWDCTKSKVSY